jgi:hypothetical protein
MAVIPDDKSLHKEYTFKYKLDTRPTGTIVYTTNEKTLVVGCTVSIAINLPSFPTHLSKAVGTAFDYEIGLPTIGRPYC